MVSSRVWQYMSAPWQKQPELVRHLCMGVVNGNI